MILHRGAASLVVQVETTSVWFIQMQQDWNTKFLLQIEQQTNGRLDTPSRPVLWNMPLSVKLSWGVAYLGKATCLCSHSWISFPERFCVCVCTQQQEADTECEVGGRLEWPRRCFLFGHVSITARRCELTQGQTGLEEMQSRSSVLALTSYELWLCKNWQIVIRVTSSVDVAIWQRQREVNSAEASREKVWGWKEFLSLQKDGVSSVHQTHRGLVELLMKKPV